MKIYPPLAIPYCRVALIGTAAFGMAIPAHAQETSADEPLQDLRECQAVANPEERLICFDTAVSQLVQASEAGDLRVVDREDIRETRRGLFGFSMPKLGLFRGSEDEDVDRVLNSTITEVRQVGRESYLLTIAEGSRWRVNDAPRRFRPEAGDAVDFERAALGSFWVRVNGTPGVKGRRVE